MLKKLTDKRKRLEQAPRERIAYIPQCYWKCEADPDPREVLLVPIYGLV